MNFHCITKAVMSETEEPIGHISAPIEDEDLQRVQTILKCHGVHVRKIRSPDNWWLLLFPDGTMKGRNETQGRVPTSTVRLPDGFSLLFEEGSLNADRNYTIPPRICVEEESPDEQSESCFSP